MAIPLIRMERPATEAILRVSDASCILVGFVAAASDAGAYNGSGYYLGAATGIVFLSFFGEVTGLYRSWRGIALYRELAASMLTWGYALVALVSTGYLTRFTDSIPRSSLLIGASMVAGLLVATRILLRWLQRSLRAHGYNTRNFAIVGVTDLGVRLARNLGKCPEQGLKLVGFFDDRPPVRTSDLPQDIGDKLGNTQQLLVLAKAGKVDRIYITFPMRAEKRIRELLNQLADTTASVYIVPDFFVFELLHSRWTDASGLPVVSVFENPFYGVDGVVKRAFDMGLASILLAILAFPMLVIAAVIKLTSDGPVFFRQRRYGLDGHEILVWKFRSMRVCENGPSIQQATKQDQRVTQFGRFLRRTSLDEIPQLFNVWDGSMSLVGPRPHANAHNEHYRRLIPGYMLRHKVKPGITGLAQVNGWRGETDTLDKMVNRIQCDHQYIREWSIWMDIKILFQTVAVVLKNQNAY